MRDILTAWMSSTISSSYSDTDDSQPASKLWNGMKESSPSTAATKASSPNSCRSRLNRSNAASMGETGTGVAVGSGAVVGVAVGSGAAVGAGTSVGTAVGAGTAVAVTAGAAVGVSGGAGAVVAVGAGAGTPVAVAGGCVGSAASSWQAARVRASADSIATNAVSLRRITFDLPFEKRPFTSRGDFSSGAYLRKVVLPSETFSAVVNFANIARQKAPYPTLSVWLEKRTLAT